MKNEMEGLSINGMVVKGTSRGRSMGFPTANILLTKQTLPQNGVYQTKVKIDGKIYEAITNIGTNPTFGSGQINVESHIFDFDSNIVGKNIEIEFVKFIRNEKKFDSVNELVAQIKLDIEQVLSCDFTQTLHNFDCRFYKTLLFLLLLSSNFRYICVM